MSNNPFLPPAVGSVTRRQAIKSEAVRVIPPTAGRLAVQTELKRIVQRFVKDESFDYRSEARATVRLAGKQGILPADEVESLLRRWA